MVLFPLKLLKTSSLARNSSPKYCEKEAQNRSEQCCLFLLKHRENWYLIFNFFAPDDV